VPLEDAESVEAYEALIDQHYRSGASEPSPFVGAGANTEPPARSGPPERISRRRSTPTGMRFAVDEDELGGPKDAPDETGGTPSTAGDSRRTNEPVDESEASGAGDPDALPDPVEVRLAPMPYGNLNPLTVAEVLYACAVTASTGRLRLIQGGLRREILFLNGMPGRADATSTQDDIGRLLSTFTWKSGEYVFEEEPISKLGFLPYGDVLDLLYLGIQRFMGMNELAVRLSSQMRLFPVYTNLFERMSQAGSLAELRDVLRRLDGQTAFERGLMKLGVDAETALRAVYFGTLTGLVVFREEATEAPLDVALTRSRSGAPTTPISSDVRRTELRDGERSVAASVAKTAEASGLTPQQQNALELLRGMERRLATLSEAEALGIPEGTSEDDAQTRFQELIRAYHPDRFASLGNAELHRLANTVFIGIRNAYRAYQQGSGARAGGAAPQRGASSPSGAPGASRVARTATTGPQRAVASSVTGPQRAVTSSVTGPQRAVTSSVTGPQRAVTGADAPESGSASKGGDFGPGRVNDALERLRRATGQHAAVAPREFETGKGRPVTAPGVRSAAAGMTQDQLVRNALRALEGDAVDKAAALVSQCRKKGGGNPLVPIIEAYIAYRQDEISSRKALKVLEEHIEALESDVVIAQTLTFCGHIQRLEEELDDAQRFYQKAAEKDRSNAEATRWIRYLRSRGEREKSSGGFLNKLLNTKITLSGKSK
jgi:hypothetical protein